MTASRTTETLPALETQQSADRLEILELTANMALLVDAREWHALHDLFTDPVLVDYTSLNGGTPASIAPSVLVDGWREALERLDATQHLLAGQAIELDGDRATCAGNVQGTHVRFNHSGGPHWTLGGRYDFTLLRTPDGWRISALTLTVQWATGNQHIMDADATSR
jgi:hypothetical protein